MNKIFLLVILVMLHGATLFLGSDRPNEDTGTGAADSLNLNSLRIMSYNIHHANPPSQLDSIDIPAIIRTINTLDPDLVALQEIDENTQRFGAGNQAKIIADSLGMHVFFGKTIDFQGGEYGVAILSKYPISEQIVHKLPTVTVTKGERRVLATVKVTLPDGTFLRFGNTHLDAQKEDINRLLQIKEIGRISSEENLPMIIAGDFNAPLASEVIKLLDINFTRTCINCEPTIPANNPQKTIDFIAYKPKKQFKVKSHKVINETYASDHLPIFSILEY